MALAELRELLDSTAYYPATLRLDAPELLWGSMSTEAQVFSRIATGKMNAGQLTFNQAYGRPWADNPLTMRTFDGLPTDAKAEVLAYFTFTIHELTHHFDYLTTPFGVNYHSKLVREYEAFQDFAPLLLREGMTPPGRLVDFDPTARGRKPSPEFLAAWTKVRDIVHTLEALGDGGMPPHAKHIVEGWGTSKKPIKVFNMPLERRTVRSFLFTVGVPDEPDWYLRPASLLETRAVVHCLVWIFHLFGKDERARLPMSIYLDAFYNRETIAPDYRMLLDLIAHGWGKTFHDYVAKAPIEMVHQVLMTADAAAWYALQAPPPMKDGSAIRSNPAIRFIYALLYWNDAFASHKTYSCAVDVMTAMDAAPDAHHFELQPIHEVLAYCCRFLGAIDKVNQNVADPAFQRHFQRIVDVQGRQISQRVDKGYISHIGMPEDGQPVNGVRSKEDVDDLAFDIYSPDPRVIDWFSFRQDFLYGYLDAEDAARSLGTFFGGSPAPASRPSKRPARGPKARARRPRRLPSRKQGSGR